METKHKEFKPFDKVLVKDTMGVWNCAFYSHWSDEDKTHNLTSLVPAKGNDILPYEGNEHLVGTTDEPDEEVKLEKGEYVFVCDIVTFIVEEWSLRNFDGCRNGYIQAFNNAKATLFGYKYAIRFPDFNPNDMEETKKHILCVKDGKIICYKG